MERIDLILNGIDCIQERMIKKNDMAKNAVVYQNPFSSSSTVELWLYM
jgi:hypothetical protein